MIACFTIAMEDELSKITLEEVKNDVSVWIAREQ